MLPLTIKQQKFSKLSSRMNPELQKIQAKYKGKKDEASLRKMQAENNAVYQKYGVTPTAGCLPLLITLPIMFALLQVIYNVPAYVNQVYDLYAGVATRMQEVSGFDATLREIAGSIKGLAIPEQFTIKTIIDVLKKFDSSNWEAFKNAFSSILDASAITLKSGESLTVAGTIAEIQRISRFLGLNISDAPRFNFPAILIPIVAGGLQFIQGKQLQVKNKDDKNNPAAAMNNSMNIMMPLMTVFFCITLPIGVGLYWIAGSVFAIVQQFFVNKYMDKIDIDELIEKNVSKATKRKEYLESKGLSISDLARTQTKKIDSTAVSQESDSDDNESEIKSVEGKSSKANPAGSKSISEIANLLKNRNEKGDK